MLWDELRLLYNYVFAKLFCMPLEAVVISAIGVPLPATIHCTVLLDE